MKNCTTIKHILFAIVLSWLAATAATAQELYKKDMSAAVKREFTAQLPFSTKAQKFTADVIDNLVIFEGDIILGPLVSFEGDDAVAIDGASYRWPNSTIPYVISAGHPQRTEILWAIAHVNSTTNLCLVPRTNQADYVQFVVGSGCASYVGKQGGRQDISINGCSRGSVAHEILHAAGLWHEQGREDRDSYIIIRWENITAGREHNFNKHVSDGIDIGVYDYGSIMHYGKTAFSKNGRNTIDIRIPPGTAATVIGQRDGLSAKDIRAINFLYRPGPCKEDCVTMNPLNITVRQSGALWLVLDGNHSLFSAPNKAEADKIASVIRYYRLTRSCFVGRPDPSFEYMLRGTLSPAGAKPGEDCISFNPATLSIRQEGTRFLLTDGHSRMFMFPNRAEAEAAVAMIRKYGFTKTCYVGRPDPSLQYMRK